MSVKSGSVYIVMGRPNSGKDTISALLAAMVGGEAISSGEEIRKSRTAADQQAQAQQAIGALVDSAHFERIMTQALARVPVGQPIVLSGVTKKPGEVDWLLDQLTQLGRHLEAVVYLDIDRETALSRYKHRRQTSERNDDNPAIQSRRLQEFEEQTVHSIARYQSLGLPVYRIDATPDIPIVSPRVATALGLPEPTLTSP